MQRLGKKHWLSRYCMRQNYLDTHLHNFAKFCIVLLHNFSCVCLWTIVVGLESADSLLLSLTVISELMVLFFGAILYLSKWEILAFMVQEKEASIRKLQAIQDYVMSFESQVQFHFSLSLYCSPFTTKSYDLQKFSQQN